MIYWQLFTAFFKTGLFSIGGGLATLPFLSQMADQYGWFTKEMLSNMLAVSESTPGPIGVNMASYAGFVAGGPLGALVATCSLVLPSLLIVLLIAMFMTRFRENRLVENAFLGIRPVVVAIVASAVWEVLAVSVLDIVKWNETGHVFSLVRPFPLLLLALFLCVRIKWEKIHPLFFIAAGALLGILLKL